MSQKQPTTLSEVFFSVKSTANDKAIEAIFELLGTVYEGLIIVDQHSKIAWISERYKKIIGITRSVKGEKVIDIIPFTKMHKTIEKGEPDFISLMTFKEQTFVVSRLPIFDNQQNITGAIGLVLYDHAIHLKPLLTEISVLEEKLSRAQTKLTLARSTQYTFSQCVGESSIFKQAKDVARKAATTDASILILGESGTGKELIAQSIHSASARTQQPFIAINMSAIPENLIELEFFGSTPNAFTGADKKGRKGKFEAAKGGTLFLDEIGDLPLSLQAKLLRALQERTIERLGSNKPIPLDVRIIAATSKNLPELVDKGLFRSDLYYRLNVISIVLPPLRDRIQDIETLSLDLLEKISFRSGRPLIPINTQALNLLSNYHWPGNIRELENALERATALSSNNYLDESDFLFLPQSTPKPPSVTHNNAYHTDNPTPTLEQTMAIAELNTINKAIVQFNGNKKLAAKLLGISRSSLYEKIQRLTQRL